MFSSFFRIIGRETLPFSPLFVNSDDRLVGCSVAEADTALVSLTHEADCFKSHRLHKMARQG